MTARRNVTWLWWLGGAVILSMLAAGMFFWNSSPRTRPARAGDSFVYADQTGAENAEPSQVQVEVTRPKKGEMDRTTSQPGSIHAFQSVQLHAGVSGYLKTLNVDIGDRVKKGAVLAQVDVPELEKQVQRYGAMVDQSRARVLQMKARALSARAEWEAARSSVPLAEATLKSKAAELRYRQQQFQRIRELAALKSIEEKLVDESMAHYEASREAEIAAQEGVTTAKAKVAAMAAKILAADADIAEADAEVKVTQAELERAQVYVRFATIVAPFDGVVTERNFFPNDYVRGANESGSHTPLLTVQRTDRMRVVVQIPDRDVPYCDPGDPAFVEIDALPGKQLEAKVARIAKSEDPDTRLMHVEIDLPNPTGKICNGMYGKVTIILDKSELLAMPTSCLVGKPQEGKGNVYVVREGKARLTPVIIGSDNGLQVAILKGVGLDDEIILHPASNLADGTLVSATHAGHEASHARH